MTATHSIRNPTQAQDPCCGTAASRLPGRELCSLPWLLSPTSSWASCHSPGGGPCPQLPVDGSVRPSKFPHTWLLNKYPNFIPLRVKNRYQMIWDTPLCQRVSVHTITFNWSTASSRFQSRSIPARCQWLLLELEIWVSSIGQGWNPARLVDHILGKVTSGSIRLKHQMQPSRSTLHLEHLNRCVHLAHECLMLKLLHWVNFRWFTLRGKGERQSAFQYFLLPNPHANSN